MTPEFEIINFKRFRLNVVANARIETLHTGLHWVGVHCYAPDGELIRKIHRLFAVRCRRGPERGATALKDCSLHRQARPPALERRCGKNVRGGVNQPQSPR